jgi:hypothetical protein
VDVTAGPPPVIVPECVKNEDCDGFDNRCKPVACEDGVCQALPALKCEDGDPCTLDLCDPDQGCSNPRATFDLDGDGYFGPLPGKRASDPDSCGNDCDDTQPAAHPGGTEVCDGVDNDCNGIVDDNARLVATGDGVLVSDASLAAPGGLAERSGMGYLAAYSAEVAGHSSVYLESLSNAGTRVGGAIQFTTVAADAYGGPLAWTGDRYGLAWSDRRDARGATNNYEVYFNLVNPDGTKRMADLRVSSASGFSINPVLAWTGSEFVVVWQDDGMGTAGRDVLFGQRIDLAGTLIGGNVKLADDGLDQTGPAIAAGKRSLGVVWTREMRDTNPVTRKAMFAALDQQLRPLQAPIDLTSSLPRGVLPTIAFNQGQYVVAWYDPGPTGSSSVAYGAVVDELGASVTPAKVLVRTTAQTRYPAFLPYGDRVLLVWSDLRDGNSGYELYATTLDRNLNPLEPDVRLTSGRGDSIDPIVSFGPNGEAGIFFTDYRTGTPQAYFTHLACLTALR